MTGVQTCALPICHQGKRPVGGEGIKVFGVHWDKEVGMVSSGEDKKVQINHGRGVTRLTT